MTSNGNRRPEPPSAGYLEQIARAEPGDAIEVWMENTYLVNTVFVCSERIDDMVTEWHWLFLDDGSLVEVSPDGCFRYRQHEIVRQGSPLYEELVAQDGALVRFEERVREGSSARRPVHVTIEGTEYRIASTGQAHMARQGEPPDLLPWQSTSSDPTRNTYFGLVGVQDEEQVGLGLWTSHICLSLGRPLLEEQVSNVFLKKG
jgi:hypothetical protein